MSIKYLDTSIVLESAMDTAREHAECQRIMLAISQGFEQVIISRFNVSEIFHILLNRENFTLDYVEDYIERLLKLKGVTLQELNQNSLVEAVQLSTKYKIDLADANAVLLMRENNIRYIYSLDSNFDKFKSIQRLTQLKLD